MNMEYNIKCDCIRNIDVVGMQHIHTIIIIFENRKSKEYIIHAAQQFGFITHTHKKIICSWMEY